MKLLISGGAQRENASKLGEGRRYFQGDFILADFARKSWECLLSTSSETDNYPDDTPNITYTAASLSEEILYLCTETEVFTYQYPDMTLI